MKKTPSEYEKKAIKEIHIWKNPELNWWGKSFTFLSKPIDKISNVVLDTKVGDVFNKTINGIISVANDAAQWSVRKESILEEYKKYGYKEINESKKIFTLDLEDTDRLVSWLDAKYKGAATLEGAATGYVGLIGIPPDIIALIGLNLRAIGEYATYYGFDIKRQQERLFAMNVLAYASSPSDSSKQLALAQLIKISQDVAGRKTWKQLEEYVFVQIIQALSKTLGIRLTKAKLAQILPISGALVAAGFNAYYTAKVCNAAFNLYRERFLAEKYGEDVIEKTVKPAKSLDPGYEEEKDEIPN